jgi:acetone carboxylase gamma subunit
VCVGVGDFVCMCVSVRARVCVCGVCVCACKGEDNLSVASVIIVYNRATNMEVLKH